MANEEAGILRDRIHQTSFAVVDIETTGLYPGADRVVELSVVRIDPGGEPRLVLDTLINPGRRVAATEIHGITDEDVADAPRFDSVRGEFVRAVTGCVMAAYNVYFDAKFLAYELGATGLGELPPYLCLMYLRPMLGLGGRCPLHDACECHGIQQPRAHAAGYDAMAGAQLMTIYLRLMKDHSIMTFGELAALKAYKFIESFRARPFTDSFGAALARCERLKPRSPELLNRQVGTPTAQQPLPVAPPNPLADYWDAMKSAMADLCITDDELAYLQEKKELLGLRNEQVRMLHARLFAGVISEFIADKWLDERECKVLHRVYASLSKLGWAPGEAVQVEHEGMRRGAEPLAGQTVEQKPAHQGSSLNVCRQPLAGMTVVVTGMLENFTRKGAEDAVKAAGGRPASSVSKKTDFVVVGVGPGSKADKARKLGVETIDEKEFVERLGRA